MEENRIIEAEARELTDRNIDIVTDEIVTLCRQAQSMLTCYIIEIGRRLKEAKAILPHGAWGEWLRNSVNFSQSTANSYMKIFDEYGSEQLSFFGNAKSQTLANLPYTKALKLLAIPEEEREEFVEANNVEDISTRELDKLIKERDEAIRERDKQRAVVDELRADKERSKELEAEKRSLSDEVEKLKALAEQAKEREIKANKRLKELKENPSIPDDVMTKIKSEAEAKVASESVAELEKKTAEFEKKIEALTREKELAQAKESQSAQKLAELEKSIKMSRSEVAVFKERFDAAQKAMASAAAALDAVTKIDAPAGEKLRAALSALAEKYVNKGE